MAITIGYALVADFLCLPPLLIATDRAADAGGGKPEQRSATGRWRPALENRYFNHIVMVERRKWAGAGVDPAQPAFAGNSRPA